MIGYAYGIILQSNVVKGKTIMAKRCTKCGNFMMEDERFCPNCGENAQLPPDAAVPAAPVEMPQQNYNSAPQYNNTPQYGGAPQYNAPPQYIMPQEEMSLKKWVGTIVVTTFFGLISLVFLFIWGFGEGPESRKNYCKAMLITMLISLGVGILMWIIFSAIIFGSVSAVLSELDPSYYDYDWSSLAATIFMKA